MQLFSPENAEPVMHASTFSGNALTMAAGRAAMDNLGQADIERINSLGERLREGFNQAFSQAGIRGQALGVGSLTNIHFTDAPVNDSRQALAGMLQAGHIGSLLHLTMLQQGVMSASRLMFCTSTAMQEADVDQAITAMHESLAKLRPVVEQERPGLLAGG
jgi:glutamate-1-semialdehyde 2,1-aminomutase